MTLKEDRQAAILDLVRSGSAATQAQLRSLLRKRGVRVDQSTLSRDLAELGIKKSGGRYGIPAPSPADNGQAELAAAVRGFVPCGPHLVVVSTTTGQAQPVAVAIDRAGEPAIMATLAGDDTIFVATHSRRSQAVVLRRLGQWFGVRPHASGRPSGAVGHMGRQSQVSSGPGA